MHYIDALMRAACAELLRTTETPQAKALAEAFVRSMPQIIERSNRQIVGDSQENLGAREGELAPKLKAK